ncbi:hypothetical protein BDA96_01G203000 [Sorghum bicolor]|uniref:Uncharacterized protein n=1 Tax=Sorghum bicolor TaxID=4558 RepID=A0A921S092_SORBI|nr:hypothetical protein BDA96_01G203000 [Sorghum bicolor]
MPTDETTRNPPRLRLPRPPLPARSRPRGAPLLRERDPSAAPPSLTPRSPRHATRPPSHPIRDEFPFPPSREPPSRPDLDAL